MSKSVKSLRVADIVSKKLVATPEVDGDLETLCDDLEELNTAVEDFRGAIANMDAPFSQDEIDEYRDTLREFKKQIAKWA